MSKETSNKDQIENEINNYLFLASNGHYPLFEGTWTEGLHSKKFTDKKGISAKKARENLEKIFTRLDRHRQVSRKKDALNLIQKKDRDVFIMSLLKLVEHEKINKLTVLQ